MTLDEMEKSANVTLANDWLPANHREKEIARALLLVLPVVREAMAVVDEDEERPSVRDLQAAVDAMRAAMTEGK